jgi:hypothetical protein
MTSFKLNVALPIFAAALLASLMQSGMVNAADSDNAAPANSGDRQWRILLAQQLRAEKTCDMLDVLAYNEMPLGDYISISGRVTCLDGREFDFSRKQPHQKFEINLCQPTVC